MARRRTAIRPVLVAFGFAFALGGVVHDATAAPEEAVELFPLPPITPGMMVKDLMAYPLFSAASTKIELRLILTDAAGNIVVEPGSATDTRVIDRYSPGFVQESVVPAGTKFDGEHHKKMLRTSALPGGGGTFKDKGGAVAVILKKATVSPPPGGGAKSWIVAAVAFACGLAVGAIVIGLMRKK